ncbi:uncharacterized protein LOC132634095 [Lycium barbarum]|uniref:uncharacterized protein LOC132634095 n=1 Tax=Lycium barbarum TaxID=112863 RepID=UPI00293F0AD9|nr:uncharacterized protein LOC132634095 [Lycium barbarum]
MPGLIVKNYLEDDHLDDDSTDSDDSDETIQLGLIQPPPSSSSDDSSEDDDDSDKEDGLQEPAIVEQSADIKMKLANIERELADFKNMVADSFEKIFVMLEALVKFTEILVQLSAGPSVSHEPGPTPTAPTTDATAAVVAIPTSEIPPIETGHTTMPDAAA